MIYTIGIIITCFLSVLLLTKRKKNLSDNLLFIWLLVINVHLGLFVLISSQQHLQFPYFLGLEIPIPLLHGPLLFLYTKSLTAPQSINRKSFLHFIPYLLALACFIPFFGKTPDEKIFIYNNQGAGYTTLLTIIFFAIVLSGIGYSLLSLRAVLKHKKRIKDNYSYTEKLNLQWLLNLIIGLSVIWIVVLFGEDKYIFIATVLYVLFIGYFGIKQVGIFSNQPPVELGLASEMNEPAVRTALETDDIKYEKSSLSIGQLEKIHAELKELMDNEKLFLTPELTLSMLAERLSVHPNTLSEVINRAEQTSFFDYVNSMRVEEFKKLVAKPENQNFTLLSIAYECGFNSKTSFNRNFKNSTGKSPSAYLKEIQITLKA